MTTFFIRTDHSIAGPFTGVELREAALAGILRHDGIVGGSQEGPWYHAADVGLFSEKKMPLPHPSNTQVPQYQVRGMPGAFQGPFKLRELIGFAARGMLPAEALLQSDGSEEWIEARRYRVLAAVLSGELVLIDESGKVVVRQAVATSQAAESKEEIRARAPIEVAKTVDMDHATSLAPVVSDEDAAPEEAWSVSRDQRWLVDEEIETQRGPSKFSLLMHRIRDRLPSVRISIPPRLAIQLAVVLLVFVGVASAISYWNQIGLQRDQVIGQWIAYPGGDVSSDPILGLSLQDSGKCLIFNSAGQSWTGDFVWEQRHGIQDGFAHIAPFSAVYDAISPGHSPGDIDPRDGYIRLQGFVKTPPVIDGHEVRDLFLRREGERLRIGYLTSLHWGDNGNQMEAGWIDSIRMEMDRPDIAADLRAIGREVPVPTEDFAGESPRHISEAIRAIREGIPTRVENEEVLLRESLAYSFKVNAAYMLKNYGIPDEARRIYRFEFPKIRNGPSFEHAQVIRYDDLKFFLSQEGKLKYLALIEQDAF